ncbi:hypothetical protein N9D23_03220 [Rubripirellula sp.]|nr:hypothetical protein [Rubripirellula sp.]
MNLIERWIRRSMWVSVHASRIYGVDGPFQSGFATYPQRSSMVAKGNHRVEPSGTGNVSWLEWNASKQTDNAERMEFSGVALA